MTTLDCTKTLMKENHFLRETGQDLALKARVGIRLAEQQRQDILYKEYYTNTKAQVQAICEKQGKKYNCQKQVFLNVLKH